MVGVAGYGLIYEEFHFLERTHVSDLDVMSDKNSIERRFADLMGKGIEITRNYQDVQKLTVFGRQKENNWRSWIYIKVNLWPLRGTGFDKTDSRTPKTGKRETLLLLPAGNR